MDVILPESSLEWLREDKDLPIVRHMHNMCASYGKIIEDITEVCLRSFLYEVPSRGDLKIYERSPLGSYTLTFADKTSHHQYWHFATEKPITPIDAKILIDVDRLQSSDRAFLEADLGPFQK